jgi:hypothetical protein
MKGKVRHLRDTDVRIILKLIIIIIRKQGGRAWNGLICLCMGNRDFYF